MSFGMAIESMLVDVLNLAQMTDSHLCKLSMVLFCY